MLGSAVRASGLDEVASPRTWPRRGAAEGTSTSLGRDIQRVVATANFRVRPANLGANQHYSITALRHCIFFLQGRCGQQCTGIPVAGIRGALTTLMQTLAVAASSNAADTVHLSSGPLSGKFPCQGR